MNLTDSDTSPSALIKHAKIIISLKTNFPRDKNKLIRTITVNNGWNTQIVQILHK